MASDLHRDDIELASMEDDGKAILAALDKGSMVSIESDTELMYVFPEKDAYLCYIHALDEPEGRCRAFPKNSENRSMVKNMAHLADHLFEVAFKPGMQRMGVMFTAEQGIVDWLDATGTLPIEDIDFMAPYEVQDTASEEEVDKDMDEGKES